MAVIDRCIGERLISLAAALRALQGFPGTVRLSVVYTLTEGNELWVEMQATAGELKVQIVLSTFTIDV